MSDLYPDGVTLNTQALQARLDAAGGTGGGTVSLPPGRYLTGSLVLRDHIHLHLQAGALLLGSTRVADYRLVDPPPIRFDEDKQGVRALLYADGCQGIRITGPGTIDGQGPLIHHHPDWQGIRSGRPRALFISGCTDVTVADLRLRNAGFWMQHYLGCDGVNLHRLDVYNHGSTNNDGLDIDGCRNVIISGCRIDSHDDAICLKSGNTSPTENVLVTHCLTRTHCNHFKIGTESNGGFRNITASHLQFLPSSVTRSEATAEGTDYRGAAGIALGCVDGGSMENLDISHVNMDQTRVPLFIKLGDRGRPVAGSSVEPGVGHAAHIAISHIQAGGASSRGGYMMGLADTPLRDVRLTDVEIEAEGGGTAEDAQRPVPARDDAYPSCDAFGMLPAYGLFVRHARGVRLSNVSFSTVDPEVRPALLWQDAEVELNRFRDLRSAAIRRHGEVEQATPPTF